MMASERVEGYAPIGAYGLLSDGRSKALTSLDGRIDWLAAPRVDSGPFLSSLVDARQGGWFDVRLCEETSRVDRRYRGDTLVLETTYHTSRSILHITDALNRGFGGILPWTELVRRLEVEGDPVEIRWELRPGNRLGTARPWIHQRGGTPLILSGNVLAGLVLDGLGEARIEDECIWGETQLRPGSPGLLALVLAEDQPLRLPKPQDVLRRLEHTCREWQDWADLIRYDGPNRDQVVRSALTIKALADDETGALAAAPTTSLPETIGSSRNYDYRFAWVRDSSFMIDALIRLGLSEQVDASLAWLLRATQRTAPDVNVFYTITGQPASGEQEKLERQEGYRKSPPVVVGNKAASQSQHGSYGDLFGAVGRFIDEGGRLDTNTGLTLATLADQVCDEWPTPDAGLWELPERRLYTTSLVNCWVALDRAVQLARQGQMPAFHLERWESNRDDIRAFVDDHCWSEAKRSYTFFTGTDELDAAVLLSARNGFCDKQDPRLWSTIDAIRSELAAEGPLLYRYSGARDKENAFAACTFWMVEALAIANRVEEARDLLEGALSYGNDVNLWAEEVEPASGRMRGNFPIGLSHLSLIGAITALASSMEDRGG